MTTTPLQPAEAAFLIEPRASSAGKFVQAAMLTLLGRGHIVIEESRGLFGQRSMRLLDGGDELLPRHLAVLRSALAGRGRALKAREVVRALQKTFGMDYRRFVHDALAPELIGRGLIALEHRKWLGLIPYRHYQRTPSGEARARPLLKLMEDAGNLKRLVRDDPDRALRLAQAAGVLLVLSPAARQQVPKLKAMLAQDGSGGDSAMIAYAHDSGGGDEQRSEWDSGIDGGDFALTTDAGGLFDGIGAVGDFTGGDGGGGDGDGGGGGD